MGRLLLVFRLAARDIRRSPGQNMMLFLAIMTSATTLAIGLALSTVGTQTYRQTKAATAGPDVVASLSGLQPAATGGRADISGLNALATQPGVAAATGPFPIAFPTMKTGHSTVPAMAEGRSTGQSAVDRPEVVSGAWVRPGGIVLEQSFAEALQVRPGDAVELGGRQFRIAGIAASTGASTYPFAANATGGSPFSDPGLVWIAASDLDTISGAAPVSAYVLDLRLTDPAAAGSFSSAHTPANQNAPYLDLLTWQQIQAQDGLAVANIRQGLIVGSWLLGLLAAASITVLVGGRLSDQNRRTGLLKAVGASPSLIGTVYLCQYLLLAALAAMAGLGVGRLVSPALAKPSAGLVGTAQPEALGSATIGIVFAVALSVAMLATLVPVNRAARASTMSALDDAARSPRRHAGLIAFSARLPVPLLLGARLAGRRPPAAPCPPQRPERRRDGVRNRGSTERAHAAVVRESSREGLLRDTRSAHGSTGPDHARGHRHDDRARRGQRGLHLLGDRDRRAPRHGGGPLTRGDAASGRRRCVSRPAAACGARRVDRDPGRDLALCRTAQRRRWRLDHVPAGMVAAGDPGRSPCSLSLPR